MTKSEKRVRELYKFLSQTKENEFKEKQAFYIINTRYSHLHNWLEGYFATY